MIHLPRGIESKRCGHSRAKYVDGGQDIFMLRPQYRQFELEKP